MANHGLRDMLVCLNIASPGWRKWYNIDNGCIGKTLIIGGMPMNMISNTENGPGTSMPIILMDQFDHAMACTCIFRSNKLINCIHHNATNLTIDLQH